MPLIPEQVLDEIQSRTDIAELIGRYVPLKRAGRHFKALCPFHKERTPSFHINTEKQIFHCFGCGVGGNIFSFLMQQERLTFPEAVHQLAEQVGVSIPARTEASRNGQTDRLLTVLEKACRYYERLYAHPRYGRAAREYLRKRGVTDRTREAFRIGCAPSGWDGLVQAAKRTNIPQGLLEQAGLVLRGRQGLVDRFRQRLMFPILDVRGRVVGFGGRSLSGQEPKYLNSPETPVYSKRRQLFGLFQAKEAIVKAKMAIVVEGYFDCVILAQAGFRHVASPLGTAFTPDQARRLLRYTESVVLAFDADTAGELATLRSIDVLIEAGLLVHVAQLPVGVDPDEVVHAYGTEAFQQLVAKAFSVFEFLLACARKRYDLHDPEARVRAAQFVLPTIARVPNAMLRAEYVRLLAERLQLDEPAVRDELSKVQPRSLQEPSGLEPRPPVQGAERVLTALILERPAWWDRVKEDFSLEQIKDEGLRRVLEVVFEMRGMSQGDPTPTKVISRLADEDMSRLVSELVELAQAVPAKEEAFQESVRRLREDVRKRHLATLREQIKTAQQFGREQEMERLLMSYQRLVKAT